MAQFKELINDHFYHTSLKKVKEKEFLELQQGRMSILQCASKFMELRHIILDYVANETLKMNLVESILLLCQYVHSYQEIYDTTINAE